MFSRLVGSILILGAIGSSALAQWQKISIPSIETNPRTQAITYKKTLGC